MRAWLGEGGKRKTSLTVLWEYGKLARMKTTLEIPDDLFREAKARAALEGRKLKDLVADGLRATLSGRVAPAKPRKRVEFPIIKGKGGVLRLTGAEVAEIEAREEAEYYARFMRR